MYQITVASSQVGNRFRPQSVNYKRREFHQPEMKSITSFDHLHTYDNEKPMDNSDFVSLATTKFTNAFGLEMFRPMTRQEGPIVKTVQFKEPSLKKKFQMMKKAHLQIRASHDAFGHQPNH